MTHLEDQLNEKQSVKDECGIFTKINHSENTSDTLTPEYIKINLKFCRGYFGKTTELSSRSSKILFITGGTREDVQTAASISTTFILTSQYKNITGSRKDDTFILTSPHISGEVDAKSGNDSLHIRLEDSNDKLQINLGTYSTKIQALTVYNVERVNLRNCCDTIHLETCRYRYLDIRENELKIRQSPCTFNLVLSIDRAKIDNLANRGYFEYRLITKKQNDATTWIATKAANAKVTHRFVLADVSFSDVDKLNIMQNQLNIHLSNGHVIINLNLNDQCSYGFSDGFDVRVKHMKIYLSWKSHDQIFNKTEHELWRWHEKHNFHAMLFRSLLQDSLFIFMTSGEKPTVYNNQYLVLKLSLQQTTTVVYTNPSLDSIVHVKSWPDIGETGHKNLAIVATSTATQKLVILTDVLDRILDAEIDMHSLRLNVKYRPSDETIVLSTRLMQEMISIGQKQITIILRIQLFNVSLAELSTCWTMEVSDQLYIFRVSTNHRQPPKITLKPQPISVNRNRLVLLDAQSHFVFKLSITIGQFDVKFYWYNKDELLILEKIDHKTSRGIRIHVTQAKGVVEKIEFQFNDGGSKIFQINSIMEAEELDSKWIRNLGV